MIITNMHIRRLPIQQGDVMLEGDSTDGAAGMHTENCTATTRSKCGTHTCVQQRHCKEAMEGHSVYTGQPSIHTYLH